MITNISALLAGIERQELNFADVLNFIDTYYDFKPVTFTNGRQHNAVGENNGSAKVFALAKLHGLNQLDTLKLFAEHYEEVKNNPDGQNHANIRNFLFWGWQGFLMQTNPLTLHHTKKN